MATMYKGKKVFAMQVLGKRRPGMNPVPISLHVVADTIKEAERKTKACVRLQGYVGPYLVTQCVLVCTLSA